MRGKIKMKLYAMLKPDKGQNATPQDKRTGKRRAGDAAEQAALDYLQRAGLTLVERNFSCKGGEIDLIMRDGAGLVFVEVRSRSSAQFGGALASITPAKVKKLQHAAQVYLAQFKVSPACRFDAVLSEAGKIEWIKNIIGY